MFPSSFISTTASTPPQEAVRRPRRIAARRMAAILSELPVAVGRGSEDGGRRCENRLPIQKNRLRDHGQFFVTVLPVKETVPSRRVTAAKTKGLVTTVATTQFAPGRVSCQETMTLFPLSVTFVTSIV